MKKEIKIIGAGISGLSAAINLAKAGYKVKVFEKNDVVGKRFHGDYQGIENWIFEQDALEHVQDLNIKLNFPYRSVKEAYGVGPDKKAHHLRSNRPFFYLVRRGIEQDTLDQALYKQAKKVGADIIFNSPKNHCQFGDIIAQGYSPDQVTDAIVVGYNFQTSAPEQYWIIVDDEVAPDGYAYCFVANGRATLGVCIFRDYDKSKEYLAKAYRIFEEFIKFDVKDKKFFSGTSNIFWIKTATFNNRLYVGEAGGFISGLWGAGIKYAMITGYLAAQSIIENKNYDQLWKKHISSHFKASIVARWYYKCLSRRSYQFFVKRVTSAKDPVVFLGKLTDYSPIHKIGLPFARFFLREKLKDRRNFE